jgi:hypothetical protein
MLLPLPFLSHLPNSAEYTMSRIAVAIRCWEHGKRIQNKIEYADGDFLLINPGTHLSCRSIEKEKTIENGSSAPFFTTLRMTRLLPL